MANNCLITKLKGIVDNNNLPYYGEMKIAFQINKGDILLGQLTDDWQVLNYKVLDGTYDGLTEFTKGGAYLKSNKLVPTDPNKNYCTLSIEKYNVNIIQANFDSRNNDAPVIDFSDLMYNSNSYLELYLSRQNCVNIDKLSDYMDKMRVINILEIKSVDGTVLNLSRLGTTGRLLSFNLGNLILGSEGSFNGIGFSAQTLISNPTAQNIFPNGENVHFSVEEFVANARSSGVTSGTINNFKYVGACNATFNDSRIENTADNPLSWTANTITIKGVTINA
jgi:hypothetical protein